MIRISASHFQKDRVQKVGLVVPSWPLEASANGIVSFSAMLRKAMQDQGMEVHVIPIRMLDSSQETDFDEVSPLEPDLRGRSLTAKAIAKARTRFPAWKEHSTSVRMGQRLARVLERLRLEKGVEIFEMEETFGWAAEVVARCQAPVVVRLHGPWCVQSCLVPGRDRLPESIRRIARERRAIETAAGVSALSRDVLERVRKSYNLPLADASVLGFPMNAPPPEDRWNLDSCDRNRIVFIGRFDAHKGGDVVVQAFRRVLELRPAAKLTFVGLDKRMVVEASGETHTFREYVEELIPGSSSDGRVESLGQQPPEFLNDQRRRALITLIPSRYETYGSVLREAMILGCPVVCSDVGGLSDILKDGENALAVPPGDAEALAAAIVRLLDAPEFAARLGSRAAEDAQDSCDPTRIVEQTQDFYRQVLDRFAVREGRERRRWAIGRPFVRESAVSHMTTP